MPNIHETLKQLADEELFAMSDTDFDVAYTLSPIEPIPTGWNTKVENPGDRKLTPKERQYNTELARHQGGQPTYPTSSLVAPTAAIDYVYSAKRKRRSK